MSDVCGQQQEGGGSGRYDSTSKDDRRKKFENIKDEHTHASKKIAE